MDQLESPPTPEDRGRLFETLIFNELCKIRDYAGRSHRISYWQKGKEEIDFIIEQGGKVVVAIECKSGRTDRTGFTFPKFRAEYPDVPILICSFQDERPRIFDAGIRLLPWLAALESYSRLCAGKDIFASSPD